MSGMNSRKRVAKKATSKTRTPATRPRAKTKAKTMPKAKRRPATRPSAATTTHRLRLGVDAGSITLADMAYLIAHGVEDFTPHADDAGALAILPMTEGPAALRVRIDAEPRIDERMELDVPSGRLFVGDVAQLFADTPRWERFLKKTKLLTVPDRRMRSFPTHSDGEFVVQIETSPPGAAVRRPAAAPRRGR